MEMIVMHAHVRIPGKMDLIHVCANGHFDRHKYLPNLVTFMLITT